MEDYSIKPEKRPKASVPVTVIVCIVFGLLAFVFAMCSAVFLSAKSILSASAVSSAVGEVNPADWEIGMFLDEESIADIAEKWYLPKDKISEDSTIAEIISDSASQYKLHISAMDIDELMDESGVMPAVGELIGAYERYLLTGEDEEPFSRKALFSEIKRHKSEIEEYTGVDISRFYDDIEKTLKDNSKDLSKLNPSELTNGAGKYTSLAFSLPVIIGCLAMAVVMAGLAALITKRPVACVRTLGIVLTAAGALLITAALMIPTVLKSALTMLQSSAVRYISDILNKSITPILIKNGAVFAAAGVLMIVISIVCAVTIKKISAKKTETAPNT